MNIIDLKTFRGTYTYILKEEIMMIKIYDKYKIEVDIIDKINGEEKIIRIGKQDLKSTIVKEINHKKSEGRLVYDESTIPCRIYEERIEGNTIGVKGIYNCDYDISFNFDEHERGDVSFYNIIENKYIIAGGWCEDGDKDEDYYDIYYVMDTKEKKSSKGIGKCEVYGDNLIIY